jgi:hypothetical protein
MSQKRKYKPVRLHAQYKYWTVIAGPKTRATTYKSHPYWKCRCKCGNKAWIECRSLQRGLSKSCGCYNSEQASTHRESKTRLYTIWQKIKNRCHVPTSHNYRYYGGRGIHVCKEWKESYETFAAWARANGYADHLSIERRKVNKGYNPSNCCWIPRNKQMENTRRTRKVIIDGKTMPLYHAVKIYSTVSYTTVCYRLKTGIDLDEALFTPARSFRRKFDRGVREKLLNV